MFTSKKAQYLDKDFNNVSPITNIDTLYYEQVSKEDDNYIIVRRSVPKHMPIKFASIDNLENLDVNTNVSSSSYIPDNINLNINYKKVLLPKAKNPFDNNTDIYDNQLYTIQSNNYVNMSHIMQYYASIGYFSSSTNILKDKIENTRIDLNEIGDKIDDVINGPFNSLTEAMYNNVTPYTYSDFMNAYTENSLVHNGVYNVIYNPGVDHPGEYKSGFQMVIKILCISNDNIKDLISLGIAYPNENTGDADVSKWEFQYDVFNNKITYLRDEYSNEGNFDFRNQFISQGETIYDGNYTLGQFINNKIYLEDPVSSHVQFNKNAEHVNNQIYDSTYIQIDSNSKNNIIKCSSHINFVAETNNINNIIINSVTFTAGKSLEFEESSSNTLINNEDTSIKISGNFNTVLNTSNLNIKLGNGNYVVGDSINSTTIPSSLLNNNMILMNGASNTAIINNLQDSIIFGGSGHDVSVYVHSSNTL